MPELPGPGQEIQEVERETRGLTSYVVLVQQQTGHWMAIDDYEATHAEAAIKRAVGGMNDDGAVYVAVPARSWKPMRVQQVQTVQTVIEAVDS